MTLAVFPLWATHIVGGEMSYKFIENAPGSSLYTYEVQMLVYRDCYNGQPWFDVPAYIGIFDGQNQFEDVLQVSPSFIDTLPVNFQSLCNATPSGFCVNVARYTFNLSLPYNASGYHIVYQRCCRNGIINNLPNPLQTGATYEVFISGESMLQHNSSPEWLSLPLTVICTNNPLNYEHHAVDAEGDSIVYQLCAPLLGLSDIDPQSFPDPPPYLEASFMPGYSAEFPMGGDPLVSINPQTGLITGTPKQSGHFVVSVCGREYRNGILLSTFHRDFQFVVSDCIESVITTQLDPVQHTVCDTTYDYLAVQVQGGEPPYSLVWSNGETGSVISNVVPGQTYGLSITDAQGCESTVNVQGNDCVWPGDANYDGVANNFDVLELGLYNGSYGPKRQNASSDWTAQPAPIWSGTVSSGRNRKHADCDGSGFVNNFDVLVIDSNYNAPAHPLAFMPVTAEDAPELYLAFDDPTLTPFTSVQARVRLGTAEIPATEIYGIAFSIRSNYPDLLIYGIDLPGIFGESGRVMTLDHSIPDQSRMDYVIVRNNQLPIDETFGDVCIVYFNVPESTGLPFMLNIEDVRLINHNGDIKPVNPVPFQGTVAQKELAPQDAVKITPNPANSKVRIQFSDFDTDWREISIFDQQGRFVRQWKVNGMVNSQELDISDLQSGVYLLRGTQGNRIWSEKLMVRR